MVGGGRAIIWSGRRGEGPRGGAEKREGVARQRAHPCFWLEGRVCGWAVVGPWDFLLKVWDRGHEAVA